MVLQLKVETAVRSHMADAPLVGDADADIVGPIAEGCCERLGSIQCVSAGGLFEGGDHGGYPARIDGFTRCPCPPGVEGVGEPGELLDLLGMAGPGVQVSGRGKGRPEVLGSFGGVAVAGAGWFECGLELLLSGEGVFVGVVRLVEVLAGGSPLPAWRCAGALFGELLLLSGGRYCVTCGGE